MRIYFTAIVIILAVIACNSKKSAEEAIPPVKKDTAIITTPSMDTISIKTDTATVQGNEWEKIGDLSLGMKAKKMTELLGQPSSKSKAEEWGADGLMHQDWIYKNKGITLNMSSDKSFAGQEIFSITITSPCDLKTIKNMGIGSTYQEVRDAYSKDIDPSATDNTIITVGSIYGGIIFNFKNDKANKIFIGAAAE